MIPKIIHYCWFSGDKKPESIKKCIESWKKHLPDYEIKCWDAERFKQIDATFAKEAYANKKWAFASDYVRLYALYYEGGIYLDSDVQVWGNLDALLCNHFFSGLEMRDKEHTQIYLEAAIMGAEKGNVFIKRCLDKYELRSFIKGDGSFDLTPIPTVISPILSDMYGWERKDETQEMDGATVYSTETIANTNCERKASVLLYHLNNRSWIPLTSKEKLLRFLKKMDVLNLYSFLKKR